MFGSNLATVEKIETKVAKMKIAQTITKHKKNYRLTRERREKTTAYILYSEQIVVIKLCITRFYH